MYSTAVRGVCYLQKKEYALAYAAILPIENMMFELDAATPIYVVAYIAYMDVICELVWSPPSPCISFSLLPALPPCMYSN